MCGIIGALTFDAFEKKSEERIRNEANIFITTQLLQATVERGKDATGVSLLWADGNFTGLKMGIPSPDFIARFGDTEKDFEGFLKLWREYPKLMKVFIGHCRKSSVGNSYDNKNNHPIQVGNIVMIHNGTLTNHEKIFDKLKCDRVGDVDSEAIGRLLHHYTKGGTEPFTAEIIEETTRRIHGTYSVLAMSGNNPYQVAQFRDGRPAEMVLVRPLKMVYIASEKKYLENVLFEYNKMSKLFASSVKFPYLKQADVEFKTLQDDSQAIWDLTIPITDKTEIGDLFDWKKTPWSTDKIWGSTTTTTGGTHTAGKKHNTGVGTQVNAQSKTTGGGTAGKEDDPTGLVWSKSLNKYKTQDGIKTTKEYGAITVDVEKGEITQVSEGGEGTSDLDIKEVNKEDVENLLVGAAETEELGLERTEEAVDAKKNSETEEEDEGQIVEVDMSADAEALKKSEEFIESGMVKYEEDEEVAIDLDASDVSVLRPLPLYALANRIKKVVFQRGFVAGYVARKKEESGDKKTANQDTEKLAKARKKIRTLKLVIKVLVAALNYRTKGNSKSDIEGLLKQSIKDAKAVKLDFSAAFTVGDLKNMPLVKKLGGLLEKD